MSILYGRRGRDSRSAAGSGRRTVRVALNKMRPRNGRQPLQFLHRKNQRAIHQPVDHKAMFSGIDVRRLVSVGNHIVERRRSDEPNGVLQGGSQTEVSRGSWRHATGREQVSHRSRSHGGFESRPFAVLVQFLKIGRSLFRLGRLGGGISNSACRQSGEESLLYEFPAPFFVRAHASSSACCVKRYGAALAPAPDKNVAFYRKATAHNLHRPAWTRNPRMGSPSWQPIAGKGGAISMQEGTSDSAMEGIGDGKGPDDFNLWPSFPVRCPTIQQVYCYLALLPPPGWRVTRCTRQLRTSPTYSSFSL